LTVKRILAIRKEGKLRSIEDIGGVGRRLEKAKQYLTF
jgi:hypothetical protein